VAVAGFLLRVVVVVVAAAAAAAAAVAAAALLLIRTRMLLATPTLSGCRSCDHRHNANNNNNNNNTTAAATAAATTAAATTTTTTAATNNTNNNAHPCEPNPGQRMQVRSGGADVHVHAQDPRVQLGRGGGQAAAPRHRGGGHAPRLRTRRQDTGWRPTVGLTALRMNDDNDEAE
jgi:hypothetical protein